MPTCRLGLWKSPLLSIVSLARKLELNMEPRSITDPMMMGKGFDDDDDDDDLNKYS